MEEALEEARHALYIIREACPMSLEQTLQVSFGNAQCANCDSALEADRILPRCRPSLDAVP